MTDSTSEVTAEGGELKNEITDRPLMLSDLFLFIQIAREAAAERGAAFEDMLAAIIADEMELQ